MLDEGATERKSMMTLERFAKLERYIISRISDDGLVISAKQLNDDAVNYGITTSNEKSIRTLLYFLTIKGYIRKQEDPARNIRMTRQADLDKTNSRCEERHEICRFALEWLYGKLNRIGSSGIITFKNQTAFNGYDGRKVKLSKYYI